MEARSHDVEVIAPAGQAVRLSDGSSITVKPVTVGQLPRLVRAIRPAFGALVALAPDSSSPGDAGGQGADLSMDAAEVFELYAEHGEAITDALCIVTGEKQDRIDALPLDDALELLRALWTVNRDFFVHRLLPLLKAGQ